MGLAQGVVYLVGDDSEAEGVCTAKVDAVAVAEGLILAAVIGCAHVIFDAASKRFQSVRPWDVAAGTGGGKLNFAASECAHLIFEAASEEFRRMANQIVNMEPQNVLAVTGTLSC
jgi:hypothetical protein